jgi:hypothetical protein
MDSSPNVMLSTMFYSKACYSSTSQQKMRSTVILANAGHAVKRQRHPGLIDITASRHSPG